MGLINRPRIIAHRHLGPLGSVTAEIDALTDHLLIFHLESELVHIFTIFEGGSADVEKVGFLFGKMVVRSRI